jgi:hypothetical protein
VGIASYDNHEIARKWAHDRDMSKSDFIQGANISSDEVARTKVKIREKLKQLPVDTPGKIIIEARENLLLFVYDVRSLRLTLGEKVANHQNLLRTVIFHSFVDGSIESVSERFGPHTFSRLVRPDRSTEESLTIRNGQCNFSVPGETLKSWTIYLSIVRKRKSRRWIWLFGWTVNTIVNRMDNKHYHATS